MALIVIIVVNSLQSAAYLSVGNQINLFNLSIEKIVVALIMTFIIINAEIDLSVASMMGLASSYACWLYSGNTHLSGSGSRPISRPARRSLQWFLDFESQSSIVGCNAGDADLLPGIGPGSA